MNKAFIGAIRKGIAAREAGQPRSSCPYRDVRKLDGRLTFSRAFQKAWCDGYDDKLTDTDRDALSQSAADKPPVHPPR